MVIKTLFSAWKILAINNLQNQLLTRSSSFLFIIGKLFNFVFTVFTIFAIFTQTSQVHGYTLPQAVIVVLFFNLITSTIQFFFRSLYTFRPILVKGDFDMDLLKPLPSFFRPILSGPDFLDFPVIIIQLVTLIWFYRHYHFSLTWVMFFTFILTFANAIIVAFSVHLSIAAFSVMTTEIDNLVAIYRNLERAGVVPTDIYSPTLRFILDYIVPVTVIVTIPAQSLLSPLTVHALLYSTILASVFLIASTKFWRYSLRRYTSASS